MLNTPPRLRWHCFSDIKFRSQDCNTYVPSDYAKTDQESLRPRGAAAVEFTTAAAGGLSSNGTAACDCNLIMNADSPLSLPDDGSAWSIPGQNSLSAPNISLTAQVGPNGNQSIVFNRASPEQPVLIAFNSEATDLAVWKQLWLNTPDSSSNLGGPVSSSTSSAFLSAGFDGAVAVAVGGSAIAQDHLYRVTLDNSTMSYTANTPPPNSDGVYVFFQDQLDASTVHTLEIGFTGAGDFTAWLTSIIVFTTEGAAFSNASIPFTTSSSSTTSMTSSLASSVSSTMQSTPSTQPPQTSNHTNVGVIVGAICGGLLVLTLASVLSWWMLRRRRAIREIDVQKPVNPYIDVPYRGIGYIEPFPDPEQMRQMMSVTPLPSSVVASSTLGSELPPSYSDHADIFERRAIEMVSIIMILTSYA
ncbi:hypothetical protein A0H81_05805 [Grifola frondosa]|uniref:Uncharacterized protein n=1 Tax=Grifola frondosa TaxID=5627 RepID=A0A1C7MC22_GRIFR|nr:hypothetical protein A0H81_05805 [Grifola frondosa]